MIIHCHQLHCPWLFHYSPQHFIHQKISNVWFNLIQACQPVLAWYRHLKAMSLMMNLPTMIPLMSLSCRKWCPKLLNSILQSPTCWWRSCYMQKCMVSRYEWCHWVLDLLTIDALLNQQPSTIWEKFKVSPLLFSSQLLYTLPPIQFKHWPGNTYIVCISDTHDLEPPHLYTIDT